MAVHAIGNLSMRCQNCIDHLAHGSVQILQAGGNDNPTRPHVTWITRRLYLQVSHTVDSPTL